MQLFYISILQGLLISVSPYTINKSHNVNDMPTTEVIQTCSVIEQTKIDNNSLNVEVLVSYKKNGLNQFEIVAIYSAVPFLDTYIKEQLTQMPLPIKDTSGITEFSMFIPLNHII